MVLSPSSLALTLVEDAPEKLLDARVQDKRVEIEKALAKGADYQLTDEEGNVFIIKPNADKR